MILPILNQEIVNWNWDQILSNWIPGDPFQPEYLTEEYYKTKHRVACFVKPKRICEIGVRAGYSAMAFLQAGYTTEYVGIDYDQGTHGGVIGYANYAKKNISSMGVDCNVYLGVDSQTLRVLPDGMYDLLHIDGDHTYYGTYHDIDLGMLSARWILIDDIDFMPTTVGYATFDAIYNYKVTECYYVYDRHYRGNVLIKNPTIGPK